MPKTEQRRFIEDDQVVVVYDDGSREILPLPKKPAGRKFDADSDPEMNSGHVFTPEELQ